MANKSIKIYAFTIVNNDPKQKEASLLKSLNDKLSKSETVGDRKILLNPDDPAHEEDLILDFDISRKELYSFGTMIRVAPAAETPSLPEDVLQKQKMSYSELNNLATESGLVTKAHYYYATDGKHVLTNCRYIKSFQTYVNEYLKAERGETIFEMFPKVVSEKEGETAADIKAIRFKGSAAPIKGANTGNEQTNITTKIKDVTKLILEKAFSGLDIDGMLEGNLISAELLIKFASKKKKDASYQSVMGAILRPLADLEDLEVQDRKGVKIRGDKLQWTETVQVETTDSGKLSEPELRQEMEKILNKLK